MRRRDLILSTYSLAVMADQLPPRTSDAGPGDIRRALDALAPPKARRGAWRPEPNMTLVDLEADLLVAGGGLAGVCAAISAARHGAKVILVQDRSRLGGNSSSEVKMHVVGANTHKSRPGWREGGLLEELRLDDAVNNPQWCWEMWDLLLYDKVVSEPNITLLLDSTLFAARTRGGAKETAIEEVMVRCDKSEHVYRIKAKLFVDATGDSRLGLETGAEMRSGRESRAELGESLAPLAADGETLGSSILFTSKLHRKKMPFRPPSWARKVTAETLKFRKINNWDYGYWWIEWGGDRDIIRDNELIRFELLSIVMGVWDYIKNSGQHPEADYYALDWVGMMPGKRGSRRMVGDHLLTQQDLLGGSFEDTIAMGGWPMDDHPPGGFDRADLPPTVQIKTPEVFPIPYRSLYSRNVSNLMMAGRNISCSHVAFTSTRVMATCAVVGQATGTAAALCIEKKIKPRALYQDKTLLARLQQTLLRDDQSMPGITNNDPLDLGRGAKVTASVERDDAPAVNLLDGQVRDIPKGQKHHWAAKVAGDGVWVEFRWPSAQKLREVRITFDSGFHRELTLSSNPTIQHGILRQAQPETVRDYAVEASVGGGWKELARVAGNHQRLRAHRFDAVETDRIRLRITATNGDEYARVFEVRCYA
ncbi:MAG: FAD-dependent oxidoreductase [Bryobacteraceae bacterium]